MNKLSGKLCLYYGLVLSLCLIAYDMFLWMGDLREQKALGVLVYVLIGLVVVLAIRKQRDAYMHGHITYGQAVGTGVLTVLAGALVTSVYQYIYLSLIDPGVMDEMLKISQQELVKRGLSDSEIDRAMFMSKKMMTPGFLTFMSLLSTFFLGAVITLIAAAFLKRNKPVFDDSDLHDHQTIS